jgi:hypothetical protein
MGVSGGTMTNDDVGSSAKVAVNFLTDFFDDTYHLVRSFEVQMKKNGLKPSRSTRVTAGLGSNLASEQWVMQYLTRLYVPQSSESTTNRMLAFHIDFAPTVADESLCLVAAVHFGSPHKYKELWENWTVSGGLLKHVYESNGVIELSKEIVQAEFVPKVRTYRAFCVPLCAFSNEGDLFESLVCPALKMYESTER